MINHIRDPCLNELIEIIKQGEYDNKQLSLIIDNMNEITNKIDDNNIMYETQLKYKQNKAKEEILNISKKYKTSINKLYNEMICNTKTDDEKLKKIAKEKLRERSKKYSENDINNFFKYKDILKKKINIIGIKIFELRTINASNNFQKIFNYDWVFHFYNDKEEKLFINNISLEELENHLGHTVELEYDNGEVVRKEYYPKYVYN